jgi:hypothetical protein
MIVAPWGLCFEREDTLTLVFTVRMPFRPILLRIVVKSLYRQAIFQDSAFA